MTKNACLTKSSGIIYNPGNQNLSVDISFKLDNTQPYIHSTYLQMNQLVDHLTCSVQKASFNLPVCESQASLRIHEK